MDEFADFPGIVPYPLIFPEAMEGVVGLTLPRKVGKAKAGEYHFVEAYCIEADCDCRRAEILVVNAKGKQVAVIEFGFDLDDPQAGPYLSEEEKQSTAAEDLLQIFVEAINDNSGWLKGMYKRYKQVRKKVDSRAYRGKAFPKPGSVMRTITPPREEEDLFADFQKLLEAAGRTPPSSRRRKQAEGPGRGELFSAGAALSRIEGLVGCYRQMVNDDGFSMQRDLQNDLRRYLLERDEAGEEVARMLLRQFAREEEDEEGCAAVLRLLFDALDLLRVDLERKRPGARRRMERWQEALARYVYTEGVDPHLGTEVTRVLISARIEILPLLHEANSRRMFAGLNNDPQFDVDPEKAIFDLLGELEEQGAGNPHELFEVILQMMAVGDAEIQINLCRLLLGIDHPVVSEAAALMLFHPQSEVREGVVQVLAEADGRELTPATLRRLIVARNWFPEKLRRQIDLAVTNARRARVECAPLAKKVDPTVYASGVDGAMAQTFQVMIPQGKEFLCCSILPKLGSGVADAFLISLAGKRERDDFLGLLRQETGALESSLDYLDRRMCQALADGAAQGKAPSHWLVAVAEQLGRDQWQAVPLDVAAELSGLRAELEHRGGRFATERYAREALRASATWVAEQPFAYSWFEDDVEVDTEMEQVLRKNRKDVDVYAAVTAVLNNVLPGRRQQWLERLVLTTLWLKSAKKPPVPWQQMFYVAEALAGENIPLKEIPLMPAVAEASFGAYMGRLAERG